LPALEGMLAGPGLPDGWLDEPAGRTAEGVRDGLIRLGERTMRWTTECWESDLQQRLDGAGQTVATGSCFHRVRGHQAGGTTPISGAIGGINEEHVRLAERLRLRRAGVPEDEDPAS
jgi:hypothetical protein